MWEHREWEYWSVGIDSIECRNREYNESVIKNVVHLTEAPLARVVLFRVALIRFVAGFVISPLFLSFSFFFFPPFLCYGFNSR